MNSHQVTPSLSNPAPPSADRATRIHQLNDDLRRTGRGGRVLLTAGVSALPPTQVAAIRRAVAGFEAFGPENDPHGEHDCAVIAVGDLRVIWKVDYYDLSLSGHSPDPADPNVTARVLTVMLAEEY